MTAAAEQAASAPPEQTADLFWETWGEASGYDRAQLDAIWYDAESLYMRLPYHNFEHATGVLWKCMELADLCEANGVMTPDRRLLIAAALHHDSGYFEDHTRYGYESKEAYSGDILVALHERYGLSAEEADAGRSWIMKTKLGERPVTLEEKILVRADLANVSSDYGEFMRNNERMRRESALLNPNFSDLAFVSGSLQVLCKYFSNDLRLGDFEDYAYRRQAIENLRRLANETAWSQGRSALGYIQSLGSELVSKMLLPRLPLRRRGDKSDS